jgi:hypothetical protein
MWRSITTVVLIIVLVVGLFWMYRKITWDNGVGSGEVFTHNNGTEHDQTETGQAYLGDQPVGEAHPTPSRSDAPGTINTEPVATYNNGATTTYAPQQPEYPTYGPQQPYTPQKPIYTPKAFDNKHYGPEQPAPGSDTLAPTPPNGLAYAGTGKYELYRQGDLTFRMDTNTGASCVLYATLEEWRRPVVYSHGCAGSWGRRHRRGAVAE